MGNYSLICNGLSDVRRDAALLCIHIPHCRIYTPVIDSLNLTCTSATILLYCEAECAEMVPSDLLVMAIVSS